MDFIVDIYIYSASLDNENQPSIQPDIQHPTSRKKKQGEEKFQQGKFHLFPGRFWHAKNLSTRKR